MLPKRLSEASYYSYAVGKWHQGSAYREWTPVGRGFDESYGFLGGGEDHFTQQTGTCRYNASNGKTTRGGVTDYWEETAGSPGRHIVIDQIGICGVMRDTGPEVAASKGAAPPFSKRVTVMTARLLCKSLRDGRQ